MQGTNLINSAINSNRQMYERLSTLNMSPTNKIQATNKNSVDTVEFYNDEAALKKKQKRKFSKYATLAFATIGIAGLVFATWRQFATGKLNPQEALTRMTESNTVGEAKKWTEKFINFSMNIDALKNEIWQSISNKLKLEEVFDKKIADTYTTLSKAEKRALYNKNYKSLEPYMEMLKDQTDGLQTFDDWYKGLNNATKEGLSKGESITSILLGGFKKTETNKTIPQRLKNGFKEMWEKGSKEIIADKKIEKVYQEYSKGLESLHADLYSTNPEDKEKAFQELCGQIRKAIDGKIDISNADAEILKEAQKPLAGKIAPTAEEVTQKYYDLLSEKLSNKLIEMNHILKIDSQLMIEKSRDIHLRNASVDVLGMIGSTGLLGAAIATADSKEERKSIALDLGIPILSVMTFSFLAGIKNIAGIKGAAAGFCFSEATKMVFKTIEKSIKKQKENNETA